MKTEILDQIINILQEKDDFLITSHLSPDGDSLGSTIALGIALKKLNKKVAYCIDHSVGEKFMFLPEMENLLRNNPEDHSYEIGVSLDCSDTSHLSNGDILKKCKYIINIDHHINNKNFGDLNYIDPTASATGEITYDILKRMGIKLDKDIAIALYTAIVTDTGNFKYSNTSPRTHLIISELLKLPILAWKINKKLFDEHSLSKVLLMGRAINNIQVLCDGKLAVTVISQKDMMEVGASPDELENIINIGRDIKGVEVSVLIKEKDDSEYRIGFRSNSYVDVAEIAYHLGGGGHKRASGCTMRGSQDGVVKQIIDIVSKKL